MDASLRPETQAWAWWIDDRRQEKIRKPWADFNHSRGRVAHYIDTRCWTIATEAVLYHD